MQAEAKEVLFFSANIIIFSKKLGQHTIYVFYCSRASAFQQPFHKIDRLFFLLKESFIPGCQTWCLELKYCFSFVCVFVTTVAFHCWIKLQIVYLILQAEKSHRGPEVGMRGYICLLFLIIPGQRIHGPMNSYQVVHCVEKDH